MYNEDLVDKQQDVSNYIDEYKNELIKHNLSNSSNENSPDLNCELINKNESMSKYNKIENDE